MIISPHELGILKEYIQDLLHQAKQEALVYQASKYTPGAYGSDEALMDLLAILDDRVESEGVEIGLSENFPHRMWTICQQARDHIRNEVWLRSNLRQIPCTKGEIREMTYHALLEYIESGSKKE
jgi:hypothetical protein